MKDDYGQAGKTALKADITMSQNNTWMHYLNIGLIILISSSIFLSGCGDILTQCTIEGEFAYINQTPHRIETPIGNIETGGILLYQEIYEVGRCNNITENSYIPPYYFSGTTTVYFNGTHCVTYESTSAFNGEGPVGIDNYRWEKIHDNFYRFTYIFTEEDYEKAELCRYTPVTRDR